MILDSTREAENYKEFPEDINVKKRYEHEKKMEKRKCTDETLMRNSYVKSIFSNSCCKSFSVISCFYHKLHGILHLAGFTGFIQPCILSICSCAFSFELLHISMLIMRNSQRTQTKWENKSFDWVWIIWIASMMINIKPLKKLLQVK